jgi:hypothetical protein
MNDWIEVLPASNITLLSDHEVLTIVIDDTKASWHAVNAAGPNFTIRGAASKDSIYLTLKYRRLWFIRW